MDKFEQEMIHGSEIYVIFVFFVKRRLLKSMIMK